MCSVPLSRRVDGAGGLRSVDSAKLEGARRQLRISCLLKTSSPSVIMLEKSVPFHESATLPRLGQISIRQDGQHDSYTPSVVSAGREMHALKRGLLWQQRDRIFSRWKERYFILTKDYLHCFKRSSGLYNISPMGQFIFKVKLVELEKVEWLNKKSYSAIGLALQGRESKILLRASSGLEDWFELLEECTIASKERRIALRKLHDPNWGSDDGPYSRDWISTTDSHKTDTASLMESVLKRRSRCGPEIDLWPRANHDNRLSLLTDIDINSWGSTPPPSAPSTFRGRPYRFNTDVFFLPQGGTNTATMSSGRSLLTPVASFRNGQFPPHNHHNINTSSMNKNGHVINTSSMNKNMNTSSMNKNGHVINTSSMNKNGHVIRYRERSQSDALNKIRAPDIENKRASYVSTVFSQI